MQLLKQAVEGQFQVVSALCLLIPVSFPWQNVALVKWWKQCAEFPFLRYGLENQLQAANFASELLRVIVKSVQLHHLLLIVAQ
jgi:hypothetical protein